MYRAGEQVDFPFLKGLILCSRVCDTQLLYDLLLCLGTLYVEALEQSGDRFDTIYDLLTEEEQQHLEKTIAGIPLCDDDQTSSVLVEVSCVGFTPHSACGEVAQHPFLPVRPGLERIVAGRPWH